MIEVRTEPLAWHDLQHCLRRTPPLMLAACQHFGQDVMIAGGFIRACIAQEEVNDIDVFVANKGRAIEIINWMLKAVADNPAGNLSSEWKKNVHETDNAYTLTGFSIPIQFVHRWTFSNPADCIQSFDFTITRAAFWWENVYAPFEILTADDPKIQMQVTKESAWHSLADARFYADLAAKRLIYTMPVRNEDAGGSMLRVLKYYQRGYRIPLDHFGAVMARLMMGVRYKAIEDGDEERWHMPLEVKLGQDITRLLKEVDPDIDPRHVAHLPAENTIK